MDPVVYDFAINEHGTSADLLARRRRADAAGYYALIVPALLRIDRAQLARRRRARTRRSSAAACRDPAGAPRHGPDALRRPASRRRDDAGEPARTLDALLAEIRLRPRACTSRSAPTSRPATSAWPRTACRPTPHRGRARVRPYRCREHRPTDRTASRPGRPARTARSPSSRSPPAPGRRWTQGAGVVKALHPFCKLGGRHRTFLEVHLAKSRRIARALRHCPCPTSSPPATSPTSRSRRFLEAHGQLRLRGPLVLSRGQSHRPAPRPHAARPALRLGGNAPADARRTAAESPRQPARRAASAGRAAPARPPTTPTTCRSSACIRSATGTRSPICSATARSPLCWRNARSCAPHAPQHRHLGAERRSRPARLHLSSGASLTFEVITRRLEDRGGGLARVNGRPRLVEGLAMPREEDEFLLTLLQHQHLLDRHRPLLAAFGLDPRATSATDAQGHRRHPRARRAHADLHHAQGRQETLGPRPGGRLSRSPSSRNSGAT